MPDPIAVSKTPVFPDRIVNLNGDSSAVAVPLSSNLNRPYSSLPEVVTPFHKSNITSLSVFDVEKAGFLSQNSIVTPPLSAVFKLDSLVPEPEIKLEYTFDPVLSLYN